MCMGCHKVKSFIIFEHALIYKDGTPIFNDGTPIIIKVESQGPQNIQLSVKPCNKVSNNSERVQVVGSWVIGTKVKIS